MKSTIKLVVAAILCLLCSVIANQQTASASLLDVSLEFDALNNRIHEQTSRLLDFSLKYHALSTEITEHRSHTAAPYLEALLKQTVTVMKLNIDLSEAVGCLNEDEASYLCTMLSNADKVLEIQRLTAELQRGVSELKGSSYRVKAEVEAEKDGEGCKKLEGVEVEVEDTGS